MRRCRHFLAALCAAALILGLLCPAALAADRTGWVWNGEYNCWEYYDGDGSPHMGWLYENGKWYYIIDGTMATGHTWVDIDGDGVYEDSECAGYFFDENGVMQTGRVLCYTDFDGTKYYGNFDSTGLGYDGWLEEDDGWHYYDHGYPAHGVTYIGDTCYGFDKNAAMVTGWYALTYEDGSRDWYYFDSDGRGHTGWIRYNDRWYYTNYGMMYTGPWEIDGVLYGFRPNGDMVSAGWLKASRWSGEEQWYYFDASGAAHNGWLQYNDRWYYLEDGVMVSGDFRHIGDAWYYFRPSGAMATGWVRADGLWYFFNASGAGRTGWLRYGGAWYYCQDGDMYYGGTYEIGGKNYTFDADGVWIG